MVTGQNTQCNRMVHNSKHTDESKMHVKLTKLASKGTFRMVSMKRKFKSMQKRKKDNWGVVHLIKL